MAAVHFYEYSCRCGEALFYNSNIVSTSVLFSQKYIFVEKTPEIFQKIYISGSNTLKCECCNSRIGGVLYRYYDNKPDLFRFSGNSIERRKVSIVLHRDGDTGEVIPSLMYDRPISLRI